MIYLEKEFLIEIPEISSGKKDPTEDFDLNKLFQPAELLIPKEYMYP